MKTRKTVSMMIMCILFIAGPGFRQPASGQVDQKSSQLITRAQNLSELITMPQEEENAASYYCEIYKMFARKSALERKNIRNNTADFLLALALNGTAQRLCSFDNACLLMSQHIYKFAVDYEQLNVPVSLLANYGDHLLKKSEAAITPSQKLHWQHEALKVYEKILVYANHLEHEKMNLSSLFNAINFHQVGLTKLKNFYQAIQDPKGLKKVDLFISDNGKYRQKLQKKQEAMISLVGEGDTALAKVDWKLLKDMSKNDADPLFRREAVILLREAYQNFPSNYYNNIDMKLIKKAPFRPKRSELKKILKSIAQSDTDPQIVFLALSSLL